MRNPNGFGTVYKLSGKRRKAWEARVTVGYDENGKQLRHSIGTFITRIEATKALAEFKYNSTQIELDKLSFKNVYEKWSNIKYKQVTPKTASCYDIFYKKHLSKLDNYTFCKLKTVHIQDVLDNIKLSSASVKKIKNMLTSIFDFAIKNEITDKNYPKFVELGKFEAVREKEIFTNEEINKLWKNSEKIEAKATLILIFTGMRINELLTLKKENIDFKEEFLFINGSKTDAGMNRAIPIHKRIKPLLKEFYDNTDEYIIQAVRGGALGYSGFKKRFNEMLKILELKKHTIHDTRHTFATMLANCGADTLSISNIIGHSDYSTTANVYTHKDINTLKKAIELLP